MNSRCLKAFAGIVGLFLFGTAACGDETMTGPQFGDLEYTPSFVRIMMERSVTLAIENASGSALGPISIGARPIFLSTDPNQLCDGKPGTPIVVTITPSSISSLAPGETRDIAVEFDLSGADADSCMPGEQEAQLPASVSGRILAVASVRFDWDGTPP